MPDTTLRKIEMLRMIPRRPPGATCEELRRKLSARGYSVDVRTIQRDLTALSGLFPLTSDEGRPAHWAWMHDRGGVGVPGHDAFSALTWTLVGEHLTPLMPQPLLRELAPEINSAQRYLQSQGSSKLSRWHARARMLPTSFQLGPAPIADDVPEAVYTALFESRRLRVDYRGRGEDRVKRLTVNPLALVVRETVYYLLATIEPHSDVRQLVLHRMLRAEASSDSVVEPLEFDLDEYIESGGFAYGPGKPIRLVARFGAYAAGHLLESTISEDQVATQLADGRIEISATVRETNQLFWWLMGFGSNVEVVEPPHLREQIKAELSNLNELYYGEPSR